MLRDGEWEGLFPEQIWEFDECCESTHQWPDQNDCCAYWNIKKCWEQVHREAWSWFTTAHQCCTPGSHICTMLKMVC